MVNQVCFQPETFRFLIFINIAILAWALYQVYQQGIANSELRSQSETLEAYRELAVSEANKERQEKEKTYAYLVNLQQNLNQDNRTEPFVAPSDWSTDVVPTQRRRVPVYTPTRGEPTDFYVVGYLSQKKDTDKTMKLFERYISSNRYEYATEHYLNPTIRIPVYTRNYDQLSDGDFVKVPGFKGKFKVFIYPIDTPRYIGY